MTAVRRGARRPLGGLLTAEAISTTGTRVSMIALPWFVLTTTGSATQTGLIAFAELLPLVLSKAFGGPVIDRVGARRVAVACDALSLVAVGLVPLLHAAGLLSLPLLLLLVAVGGALRGPGDAAKNSLIPAISTTAGVSLERTTGLSSSVERTASMLGAALAGGLVAWLGPAQALVVDAASFGLSAVVIAWATARLAPAPGATTDTGEAAPDPAAEPGGYWSDLRAGWRFLRQESVVLALSLMVACTNLLDMAYAAVLVPVWAHDSGRGAATVGLVFAVFSGASIVGSLVAAAYGERLPRFRIYVLAFLITGLPRFVVLAVDAPLVAVLTVSVVGGIASGFLNPILGAVFFERVPAPLLGRVSSLNSALAWSLMPFGGVLGGLVADGLGIGPGLTVIGVAYLAATMAPLVIPSFRAMDRPGAARPVVLAEAPGTS
ncbi:MAG: MFS transporter [Nocardioidaceae bacterium]|nr:MFS transporter [Nocardioidaceae bacterium]